MVNEKFLPVSAITFLIAAFCNGVISFLQKITFPFKSKFCKVNFEEISTEAAQPTIKILREKVRIKLIHNHFPFPLLNRFFLLYNSIPKIRIKISVGIIK